MRQTAGRKWAAAQKKDTEERLSQHEDDRRRKYEEISRSLHKHVDRRAHSENWLHLLLVAGVELSDVFSHLLTRPFGEAVLAPTAARKTTPDDVTIESARVAFSRYSLEYSPVKISEGWQIAATSRRGGYLAILGEIYGTAAEARTAAEVMEALFAEPDESMDLTS
ncbi:hypothetical protein ACFCXF_27695 [Streptomyces virginiae]|uniref:hypothetical protein n=1 Tax=Streptomyces virginiae TaxID=1961 RepID=UPI0035E0358F